MNTKGRAVATAVVAASGLVVALPAITTRVDPPHHLVTMGAAIAPLVTATLLVAVAVAVAVALALHRPGLAAVLALPAMAAGAAYLPDLLHSNRGLPATPTSIEIFTANVNADNEHIEDAVAEALRSGADVVLFQEITAAHAARLEQMPELDHFPHTVVDPRPGYHGSAILSRFPLASPRVVEVGGWPVTSTTVHSRRGPFTLVNVHLAAPLDTDHHRVWKRQLEELGDLASSSAAPLVLAGDFNASASNRPFRDLLATGLRDAHDERGSGWGATWPADAPGPALLRLDHVLVSERIEVLSVERRGNPGSDHLALCVVIELGRST